LSSETKALTHLESLEAESIHVIREVVAECERPVMLYSIGKDSAVMVHLARKAFHPSAPPFPLLHVDTTWKFKEMYAMRDRMPKELGGAGGAANPEMLFAMGYAACFHSALKLVAGQGKLDVADSEVSASVGIGATDNGGFGLTVELDVRTPHLDRPTAEALVAKAHEVCPYSNATRGNIPVTLTVI